MKNSESIMAWLKDQGNQKPMHRVTSIEAAYWASKTGTGFPTSGITQEIKPWTTKIKKTRDC